MMQKGFVAVLAGGVGGAKILSALKSTISAENITAIVNTGDDMNHCGLHISPDIDTIIYTLSGQINKKTGWGLRNESWNAMQSLKMLEKIQNQADDNPHEKNNPHEKKAGKYGWFNLGDRDLGTHLYRTARLAEGAKLSQITAEIASQYGAGINILPMTDDPVYTRILPEESAETEESAENGTEISFQEYFVKLRHSVAIQRLRFEGAETAQAGQGVVDALKKAEKILIAPSNPLLSIGPILAIKEIARIVSSRRKDTCFVSPLVGGKALKGPADRVLKEMGYIPDSSGVARFYSDFADSAIIDIQDEDLVEDVESLGIRCLAVNTIMSSRRKSTRLVENILDFMQ